MYARLKSKTIPRITKRSNRRATFKISAKGLSSCGKSVKTVNKKNMISHTINAFNAK